MGSIDIDELLRVLPKLIRESDVLKGAIISALSGVVATRQDIQDLMAEMDRRFEAMDKRFEALQREMDARFEALQREMDARFEAMDKRFEAMDKRFEAMDKRFEAMDKRFEAMDKRFDEITMMLGDLTRAFGAPFEQFARNVISRILEGEGIPGVKLQKEIFPDPSGFVFPESKEVEIDGFSLDPPILVEITSVLRDQEKVTKFIKKKEFIERREGKKFRGFFVSSTTIFTREQVADITVLLRSHGCELIYV